MFLKRLGPKVNQEALYPDKADLTVQARMSRGNLQDSTKVLKHKLVTNHQKKYLYKEVEQCSMTVMREAFTSEEKAAQEVAAPLPTLMAIQGGVATCPAGRWVVHNHLPTLEMSAVPTTLEGCLTLEDLAACLTKEILEAQKIWVVLKIWEVSKI